MSLAFNNLPATPGSDWAHPQENKRHLLVEPIPPEKLDGSVRPSQGPPTVPSSRRQSPAWAVPVPATHRTSPLLRPIVHSGFLRRTYGSPSSAPRRRSLPHGWGCGRGGGCSPSPGCSIRFTSDETRKRRVRRPPRTGCGPLPSPRPPGLPHAPRRTRNRQHSRRCQETSRIPQLIRQAGPAASAPCDWLAV